MAYRTAKPLKLFFDCETLASPENCALMPDPIIEAPGNYKDPEKIKEYIAIKTAEAKTAALDRAALDPDYGKILSIGWASSDSGPVTVHVVGEVSFAEQVRDVEGEYDVIELFRSEQDLILEFWELFARRGGNCVGYNILGFDLPYLLRRSMALGIRVPVIPMLAKFRTEPVTDLMAILYNWGSDRYKSLKQVAKLYKIPVDRPDLDGSMVANMNPWDLVEYQASDVHLCQALYQRMNGVYFSHG